jgi:hypothetical protein
MGEEMGDVGLGVKFMEGCGWVALFEEDQGGGDAGVELPEVFDQAPGEAFGAGGRTVVGGGFCEAAKDEAVEAEKTVKAKVEDEIGLAVAELEGMDRITIDDPGGLGDKGLLDLEELGLGSFDPIGGVEVTVEIVDGEVEALAELEGAGGFATAWKAKDHDALWGHAMILFWGF